MDKHAQVIFETGAKSVIRYDDEAELRDFITEHTDRAKNGRPGSAQDWSHKHEGNIEDEAELADLQRMAASTASRPAERIKKVLLYDRHPAEYREDGVLTLDQVNSLVAALSGGSPEDATINVDELITALRREAHPVISGDIGPHDSMYKMPHSGELDLGFLDLNKGGDSN